MGHVEGTDDGIGFGVKGSSAPPRTGKGVEGVSPVGDGVFGQSEAKRASGVHGVHDGKLGNWGFGVFGETKYGPAAVKGQLGGGSGMGGAEVNASGVAGDSTEGPGVSGTSSSAEGVLGEGASFGVRGSSTDGDGVFGESGRGKGVHGLSHSPAAGVVGENAGKEVEKDEDINAGVFGTSLIGEGVHGETNGNRFVAGVTGLALLPDGEGPGVFGESRGLGDGVIGKSNRGGGVVGIHGDPALREIALPLSKVGVFGASENGAGVLGYARDAGSPAVWAVGGLWAAAEGNPLAGKFAGDVEIQGALQVDHDVEVKGNLQVEQDIYLPGADCAEQFDVGEAEQIQAGAVVVIDEHGRLRKSHGPYDRHVAGVVAGAGSYRSAIVLDKGVSSEHRLPVALAGKVFCMVDAQYAPIAAGDLLTSSPTVGHAMKAADALRAFGAVIGKALQPCHEGVGLIAILVCLS